MPSSPGPSPRPHSAGARVVELTDWQRRRYPALRAHAEAPTDLVDELPDEPIDEPAAARAVIDRHRRTQIA